MNFQEAQYKYLCFMNDVFLMSNVNYPCEQRSYKRKDQWFLYDDMGCYLARILQDSKQEVRF